MARKSKFLLEGPEDEVIYVITQITHDKKFKGIDWKELSPELQERLREVLSKMEQKELGI